MHIKNNHLADVETLIFILFIKKLARACST